MDRKTVRSILYSAVTSQGMSVVNRGRYIRREKAENNEPLPWWPGQVQEFNTRSASYHAAR